VADRIVFTGSIKREKLGSAYAAFDIFAFPSLTDTQGWVLHEAAHAGLPIVLIDKKLSEVMRHEENGLHADDSARSIADKINAILSDSEKHAAFSKRSKELAAEFTEREQVAKLIELYKDILSTNRSSDD
jgi:1,2-diacylglycerol 3-alpha-glucosyltransferase